MTWFYAFIGSAAAVVDGLAFFAYFSGGWRPSSRVRRNARLSFAGLTIVAVAGWALALGGAKLLGLPR